MPLEIPLSGPTEADILHYRGDSGQFRLTFTDNEDPPNPIDVSGMAWDADIRLKRNDEDPIAQFEVVPVVGQNNAVDVILTFEEARKLPKKCYYDIEMTDGDDVTTVIYGEIKSSEDVSRP